MHQDEYHLTFADLDALFEAEVLLDGRDPSSARKSALRHSLKFTRPGEALRRYFHGRASRGTPAYSGDGRSALQKTALHFHTASVSQFAYSDNLLDELPAKAPAVPHFRSRQQELESLVATYTDNGNMVAFRRKFGDEVVAQTNQRHAHRSERTRLSMFYRPSMRLSFHPRQSTRLSSFRPTDTNRVHARESFSSGVDRILDAPGAQQTPCIRQLAWCDVPSTTEFLAISLTEHVYLWDPVTADAHHLHTLHPQQERVSCLSWCPNKPHVVFSDHSGITLLMDIEGRGALQTHALSNVSQHKFVTSHCWRDNVLVTGLSDGSLSFLDVRCGNWIGSVRCSDSNNRVSALLSGKRPNEHWLAVGTLHLDNPAEEHQTELESIERQTQTSACRGKHKLFEADKAVNVFDVRYLQKYIERKNFVASLRTGSSTTGLAWHPKHPSRLLTGSRNGLFSTWDVTKGAAIETYDTGRAIGSLFVNRAYNEVLTTHYGFPSRADCFQQLHLWSLDRFAPITPFGKAENEAEAAGQVLGVLDATMAPSGETICALTGDALLKFWRVFPNDLCAYG